MKYTNGLLNLMSSARATAERLSMPDLTVNAATQRNESLS
jgi:hypothetical protein